MTIFHLKCYNECIRISKAYRDKVQLTHIVLFKKCFTSQYALQFHFNIIQRQSY